MHNWTKEQNTYNNPNFPLLNFEEYLLKYENKFLMLQTTEILLHCSVDVQLKRISQDIKVLWPIKFTLQSEVSFKPVEHTATKTNMYSIQ